MTSKFYILIIFVVILCQSSCKYFSILKKEDEEYIRDILDSIKINIPFKVNGDRIFVNVFYDMTGNAIALQDKVILSGHLNWSRIISGSDPSGIALQYMKIATFNYEIKIKRKNIEYVIELGYIKSYSQFSGTPSDLFSEYTAELNAEENVARQLAREVYYNVALTLRNHISECKRIKVILDLNKEFVYANYKGESDDTDILALKLRNIDLKNIKKRDYEIYRNACKIL